jgi:hypothetical protein
MVEPIGVTDVWATSGPRNLVSVDNTTPPPRTEDIAGAAWCAEAVQLDPLLTMAAKEGLRNSLAGAFFLQLRRFVGQTHPSHEEP